MASESVISTSAVSSGIARLHMDVAELRRSHSVLSGSLAELRGEHIALREFLVEYGVVRLEALLAWLHRQRFMATLRAHPSCWEASLAQTFGCFDLAPAVLRFVELPTAGVLSVAAKFLAGAVRGAIQIAHVDRRDQLYMCGGVGSLHAPRSAERFDPATGAWECLKPMLQPRSYAAAATFGGRLYTCGGYGDDQESLSSTERFDPPTATWEFTAPMAQARGNPMADVLGTRLYVCGGVGVDEVVLGSAERFDPTVEAWEALPPMIHRRYNAAVAVVRGCLYACGGGSDDHPLNSAERLDLAAGVWKPLPAMMLSRHSPATAVLNSCLYVCGGLGGNDLEALWSVERFDPTIGTWEMVAAMTHRRHGAVAAVLGGHLYICAGEGGDGQAQSSVERFDPMVDAWEPLASMTQPRKLAAAAVLNGCLYICGGCRDDVDDGRPQSSAERLDPSVGIWEALAVMTHRRALAAVAVAPAAAAIDGFSCCPCGS